MEIAYSKHKIDASRETASPYNKAFFESEKKATGDIDSVQVNYIPREDAQVDADKKRLDRLLDRTLYLIVKEGAWRFPESPVDREGLDVSAKKWLEDRESMSAWVVGKAPAALYKSEKEKVFFMKSQILSGKVEDPKEHAWVTKQEMAEYLDADYYAQVKDALAEH
jgi:large subunit ribosomal protein L46